MYNDEQTPHLFLSEEFFIIASIHEHGARSRYRLMSLRFLPLNPGISQLLEALASESEQRLQALIQAAKRLQATGCLPAEAPPHEPPCDWDRHFFLINEEMAATALAQVIYEEQRSLHFYRRLQAGNGAPELDSLLAAFIDQTLKQCRVLQDCQEQLLLSVEFLHEQRRSA